jgi:hypothetical protein
VRRFLPAVVTAAGLFAALGPSACSTKHPEESTYFERSISPILTTSCVRTNTGAGCHVADAKGNALGNLDVATFAGVAKRRDLLVDYGPYGQPALLLKNIEPFQLDVTTFDGKKTTITTDIKHAGGSVLDATGSGYQTLRRWIQNGATENNTGTPPATIERLPCSEFVPSRPDFDLTTDPARPDFATFKDKVNPVYAQQDGSTPSASCAAGNCHGTVANSLYLTCGRTPEQLRWNYLASEEYLAQTPEQSELLRRPLSAAAGGAYHEGGTIFASPSDPGYAALQQWAQEHGPLVVPAGANPGFDFFSQKVQPVLVKKGCMMLQCHSASMFHDYRLHGGSGGSFSLAATRRNYELSLVEISPESDDPNASRIIRKNLYRPEVCGVAGCDRPSGIAHRGGPLLEDFGGATASQKACDDAKYDYDAGDLDTIPPYCVIAEWIKRERDLAKLKPLSAIVWVKRPVGSVKRAQDFDVYAPGADLMMQPASIAAGVVTLADAPRSLTAGCGLSVASADIRRPQVSWDGSKIAFAARSSAAEPLAVYEMNADGTGCAKNAAIDGTPATQNGLLIHNFDPTYVPEPGSSRLVFASTRGNLRNDAYDYQGPQRTPSDPTKPNANLYLLDAGGTVRQLTYLLDMERQPSFMGDGRLIFPAVKRAPNFYQIALRRMNLDGADYHPLYAQRGSIGFPEATQVVELADRNFATIMSDQATPNGGGALAVFNRSLGIDFQSKNAGDYLVDPAVIDPAALEAPDPAFFLHSLRFPDPPGAGLYTSPSALPDARVLVSFGAGLGGDYDLYVMDPNTGAKDKLLGDAGSAEVDAVAVYGRLFRPIFHSIPDEPNANTTILPDRSEAEITVLDMRVLASLLFQNTPTGRLIEPDLDQVSVYEDMPPPLEVDSFDKGGSNVVSDAFGKVFVRRRLLGVAPIEADGSTKFNIPGGVPIVLKLPDTKLSRERGLPRTQREEMEFAPGEYAHQSFREGFFGALCGNCHGSISGRPVDAALQPDFVTQASATIARNKPPFVMNKPPSERGPIEGPPAGP